MSSLPENINKLIPKQGDYKKLKSRLSAILQKIQRTSTAFLPSALPRVFQRYIHTKYIVGVISVVIIVTLGLMFLPRSESQAWYNDNWSYRKKLTIDSDQVSGSSNLRNFPVLVSLTDTELSNNAQADGDDILFTDNLGNKLDHEIESYSSGTLAAWVRMPSLSPSNDTDIYMYYGNESSADQSNSAEVWDTDFLSVYHIAEDQSGTGNTDLYKDSTSNGFDGDDEISATGQDGKIGNGNDFDGSDDYINVGDIAALDFGDDQDFTLSAWINRDTFDTNDSVITKDSDVTSISTTGYKFFVHSNDNIRFIASDGTNSLFADGPSTITSTGWHYVTIVYDSNPGGNPEATVYLDASAGTPASGSVTDMTNALDFRVGAESDAGAPYDGKIDEVRVSNIQRSSDWIATEYNNQNSPSTFFSLGTQEESPKAPGLYYKFNEAHGYVVRDSLSGGLNGEIPNFFGNITSTKIDDASDFGVMDGTGRQVIRASNGDLYSAVNDGGSCEIWKSSDNGSTWSEQDSANNPSCISGDAVSIAVDSQENIHIAYAKVGGSPAPIIHWIIYNTSTETFGIEEQTTIGGPSGIEELVVALDLNDKPHIAGVDVDNGTLRYTNRLNGTWISDIDTGVTALDIDFTINNINHPIVSYRNGSSLSFVSGNKNNATSFSPTEIDTSVNNTVDQRGSSIAVDTKGNTWIAYVDSDSTIAMASDVGGWTTDTTNTNVGYEPSIAMRGNKAYVFYENDADDIAYDIYNTSTSTWAGETVLHTGTFQDVKVKWANHHDNLGIGQLDYLYSDDTDIYYDRLSIASEGGGTWASSDICVNEGCLEFDGSDDVVMTPSYKEVNFSDDLASEFTISTWVRPVSDGEGNAGEVFEKGANNYIRTTNEAEGLVDLEAKLDLGTTDATVTVTDGLTLNKWHHVELTYTDDADDEITLYINGAAKGTSTNGDGSPASDSNDLLIGGSSDNNYHGFIDEFKIYPYARTADEIKTDFTARGSVKGVSAQFGDPDLGKKFGDGLIGYWKAEEDIGGVDSNYSWHDSDWTYRKQLTIDNTQVSGTANLSNVPVLISTSTDADLVNHAQADGDDIFFTDSNGTKLSHEIESYSDGTLNAWVKVPTLSHDTDTVLLMYYGNETATNQEDTANAWDSNHSVVYHVAETTSQHTDSTSNSNDTTSVTVTTQGSATGKINGATEFDGTDDNLVTADATSLDVSSSFTIESWIKPSSTAANMPILTKGGNYNFGIQYKSGGNNLVLTSIDSSSLTHTRRAIETGTNADGGGSSYPVDFDGDGDIDVVTTAAISDEFAWYENDGTNTSFTRHVIESGANADGARSSYPVDFDGDGDIDVVTAASTSDEFAWYENDGTNTSFTRHVIESGANADGARSSYPVDFDGDGDIDVVTAASTLDEFAWYENDGTNTTFTRHVIESGANADFAVFVHPVDFDGDGDIDVVTAAIVSDEFAWYENDGTNTTFTRHVIETGTTNADSARWIYPVDFDGDGDIDVVTAANSSDEFAWYENDGTNTSFTRHVIETGTTNAFGAQSIFPVDFDGDGDIDVVTAANVSDEFAWYENDGTNTSFTRHVIETGTTNAEGADSIHPVDFDGDGDIDVVTAASTSDEFAWYETGADTATQSISLTTNDWTHLGVTYDGTNASFYKNGSLLGSSAITIANTNNEDLHIGRGNKWLADNAIKDDALPDPYHFYAFGGLLDEIRIHDTARSTDWITTQYNTQNASSFFSTGTVEGLYRDSSGNNNYGTPKNDTTTDSGKFGGSMKFDGTGDYVEVGDVDF